MNELLATIDQAGEDPYLVLPEVMVVAGRHKDNPIIMEMLVRYDQAFRELYATVKLIEGDELVDAIKEANNDRIKLGKKIEAEFKAKYPYSFY